MDTSIFLPYKRLGDRYTMSEICADIHVAHKTLAIITAAINHERAVDVDYYTSAVYTITMCHSSTLEAAENHLKNYLNTLQGVYSSMITQDYLRRSDQYEWANLPSSDPIDLLFEDILAM